MTEDDGEEAETATPAEDLPGGPWPRGQRRSLEDVLEALAGAGAAGGRDRPSVIIVVNQQPSVNQFLSTTSTTTVGGSGPTPTPTDHPLPPPPARVLPVVDGARAGALSVRRRARA